MQKELESLWQKCVAFHGHGCGGLAVGFRAVLYAWELFESDSTSEDEEIVCIAETDACGVDAIQALLSCTVGKGNLIFNLQGKNAFSFYRRPDGKSFRLVLRPTPEKTKDERLAWLMDGVLEPSLVAQPSTPRLMGMPALRIPGMSKISLPPSMVGAGQWEMPMWFSASRAYSSGSVSRP